MTEAQWLACTEPALMLQFLGQRISDRKLRLFACACCRRIWRLVTDARSQNAVEVAERYADGLATTEELVTTGGVAEDAAHFAMTCESIVDSLKSAAFAAVQTTRGSEVAADHTSANAASAAFHLATETGAPSAAAARQAERAAQCALLREIVGNPFRPVVAESAWLHWNDGCVVKIAQAIYEEQRWDDLPILADALEDAGCDNEDVLGHIRKPGLHVRGCWVVDLLLGKS